MLVLADAPGATVEQASANLSAFLGVAAGAALGRRLDELLPAEAAAMLRAAPERVQLTGCDGQALIVSSWRRDDALVLELEPVPAAEDAAGAGAAIEQALAAELESASQLQDIVRATVGAACELARFDRTLISRLREDGSSEVIAEIRRSNASAFLGLRCPESEFPAAERAAALGAPLRCVADTRAEPVALLPALNPRTGRTTGLEAAILRAAPREMLAPLRERGVVTLLNVSLIVEGRLWGMLVCHHESPRQVGPQQRAALAALAGQAAAALGRVLEVERSEAERRVARRLAAIEQAVLRSDNVVRQLLASDPGLLDIAAADGLAVVAEENIVSFGLAPEPALIRRLAARVAERPEPVLALDTLSVLEPDALACRTVAAGMLAVALTADPLVVLIAFRREQVREVIWGGGRDPAGGPDGADAGADPGIPFAHWRERVVGHCRPWEPEAVAAWQSLPAWLGSAFGSYGATALRLIEDLSTLMAPSRLDEPFLRALLNAVTGMLVVGGGGVGAAAEVQVANRDFRQLFGAAPDALFGAAPDALFGVVPDALLGRPVGEVLASIGLGDPAIAALAPGAAIEATVVTAGFGERDILISRQPLLRLGSGQERDYSAWTFEDVSPARRVEAALRSAREQAVIASRGKAEFLSRMSHALRTPLNTIIGFSEIMRAELFGALGSAKYKEYVRNIQSSGESLLAVIRNLLEVSKVETGHYVLEEQAVDLVALLRGVCLAEHEQAQRAGVRLMQEVAARQMPIHADGRAIRQILLNLLSNSFKFTPAGGMVTCRALMLPTGGVALEVRDTGIGMPEDFLNRAFEPAGQGRDRQSRKQAGGGLGLALVRALAELHGGRVTIASHASRGTAIRVGLPAWRTMPADAALAPPPPLSPTGETK